MAQFKTWIDKSQLLWAIICIIGFGIWQFVQVDNFFATVNIVWIVLAIIGLGGTFVFNKNALKHPNKDVVIAWVVLVVLAELASILLWLGPLAFLMKMGINYGVIWAVFGVLGFAYTGFSMKNRPAQYVAAILCLLILLAMVLKVTPIAGFNWAFVPLGLAMGLPMIYDAWVSN